MQWQHPLLYFLLLPYRLEFHLCRADNLLHFVIIQQPVTVMKDLSSCQPNGSDTQTKWNNSEWSWQLGNFRNKLIWQGVFITLQGTGWSDKNRSWEIDYLLENDTLRWYSEMRGGSWSWRQELGLAGSVEMWRSSPFWNRFCHLRVS